MKLKDMSLLVISENTEVIVGVSNFLKGRLPDCTMLSAPNRRSGMELALVEKPDAIFFDANLTDKSEISFCEYVKANSQLGAIPLIYLVPSDISREERIKVLQAGADAIISKPFDEVEVTTLFKAMQRIKRTGAIRQKLTEKVEECAAVRKIEEQALDESNERYRAIFENMAAACCIDEIIYKDGCAVDYRLLDVNPTFEQITGISRSKAIGALASELYGLNKAPFLDIFCKVAETGEPAKFETYFAPIRKHIFITVGCPGPGKFSTVFSDITEQKHIQDLLGKAASEYHSLAEHIPDLVARFDKDLRHIYVNPAAASAGKFDASGYIGKTIAESGVTEDAASEWEGLIRKVFDTGEQVTVEREFQTTNGPRFFLTSLIPEYMDGEIQSVLSLARDITERKTTENVLRESEDRFKYVFESANVGKSITLPTGEIYVNKAFADLLGYTKEELQNRTWQQITPVEDIEYTQGYVQMLLSGQKESTRFKKRYIHKDGSHIWADVSTAIRRDKGGTPQYFITTIVDITEHERAEVELRQSKEKFAKAFKLSPNAITITRLEDGKFLEVNDGFLLLTGYSREESYSSSSVKLKLWVNEDDRSHVLEILRTGQPLLDKEYQFRVKDGHIITGLFSTQVIELGGETCVLSSITDITDRKKSEERINSQLEELKRWQSIMLGREDRVQELKREVNQLCRKAGLEIRYPSQENGQTEETKIETKP